MAHQTRTETTYRVAVSHIVQWEGDDKAEAVLAYERFKAEAFDIEIVTLTCATTMSTEVARAPGQQDLPPYDPDKPIRPLSDYFPEVSGRRGGIKFGKS